MKDLLTTILLFPCFLFAQSTESICQPKLKELHVRTFTAWEVDSGKQQVLYRESLDTLGRMTSRFKRWNNSVRPYEEFDTMFFRGDTSVFIQRDAQTDSSVSVYGPKASPHRMTTTEYDDGRITTTHVMGGDSLFSYYKIVNERPGGPMLLGMYTTRTFDASGRETTERRFDTTSYGGRIFVSEESYTESFYSGSIVTEKTYEPHEGKRKLDRIRYYDMNNPTWDSTINYDRKGRIQTITVSRTDSTGQPIFFASTNRKGKLNYMITWERTDKQMVQTTYNSEKKVDRTLTTYYRTDGLIWKEVEVGIEQNSEIVFVYTFF